MNAIVTGATKGIGYAICVLLAKKGYNLAICSRSEDDLSALTQELKGINSSITVLSRSCDVSDQDQVESFADIVLAKWTSIDVLVNNAGLFIPGEIHKEEAGALEKMITTNLYSAYHLTRKVAPAMIEKRSGHIFNMCSIASIMAYPNGGSYSISKYALLGFSKVLRAELQDKGVKVTAILPGATWSNSWAGIDLPQDRLMEANDIALALWNALQMSPSAVVEEILIRPQLGDL